MDAERHRRVKAAFAEVCEAAENEREAVLARVCGDDAELRREVEGLLAYDRGRSDGGLAAGGAEGGGVAPAPAEPDDSADPHRPSSSHFEGDFAPGQVLIGRYRIVALIGEGGMGQVYLADDLVLAQPVAVKFLPAHLADRPGGLERFRAEVRHAREVTHPNVARVHDIGEVDGRHFLTMEYVDGEDLSSLIKRIGRLPREKASQIAQQVCSALAEAHHRGVLHRDLKPANVMLDGEGRVRLTDFGLAIAAGSGSGEALAGTPQYMAPEQLAGVPASVRSEVYSLGLLLYELYTGKRALRGRSLEELRREHEEGPIEPPSSALADIEEAVDRVITSCLARDPKERPLSVLEVARALPGGDPLAAALAAGETPSPELVANAQDQGGLRPAPALAALAIVIALAFLIGFVNATKRVFPARSPAALSTLAEQHLVRLGFADLPEHDVAAFDVNKLAVDWEAGNVKARAELEAAGCPPPYLFWRRWSNHPFPRVHPHRPDFVRLETPPRILPGEVSVILDPSTGDLLELLAVPGEDDRGLAGSGTEVDWRPLLTAAGFDPDRVRRAGDALPDAPTWCTSVRAWDIERPGDETFRVESGAVGARPAWLRVPGATESAETGSPAPPDNMGIVVWVMMVLIALVGWRNLRLGRGDQRNAFRCALLIAAIYALIELLSAAARGVPLGASLAGLVNGTSGGHVVIHGVQTWIFYMAIEPYARRLWPRMLVGWMRMLSGRGRDPQIGREILLGALAGASVIAASVAGKWIEESVGGVPFDPVVNNPSILSSTANLWINALYGWAAPLLLGVYWLALMVVIHLLARNRLLATGLGILVLSLVHYRATGQARGYEAAADYVVSFLFAGTWVLMLVRVGFLSGCAMWIVAWFLVMQFSSDLSAWHAPWTFVYLGTVVGLAGYGFWTAIAGQPILRELLDDDRASAART